VKSTAREGFILVATLWFVALLALAAVVIEGWISTSLDRGASLGERVAARAALLSAKERIAFIMAGGSVSARGLELLPRDSASSPDVTAPSAATPLPEGPFIALDDRPYRIGAVVIRLQDSAGLYDINNANRDTLDKFLKGFGVTSSDREKLSSTLFDYLGKSPDIRAGGILETDYSQAALPPPRHNPLLTPWELLRVLDWGEVKALWQDFPAIPELVTLGPIGGLNVNTAPAKVLTALSGMDESEAARLVLARAVRPITDLRDIQAVSGSFNGESRPLAFTPANIIRLKMTSPGEPLMLVMEIRLTPSGGAPYRVDYAFDIPQDATVRATVAAPPLPALPASSP
jgi:hypothetical protein